MLGRQISKRIGQRCYYMTKIISDFNQQHNFARIQGGVYISPYPTPPETMIYNNLESSLRLSGGGRFINAFGLIGLQSVYYFYKVYTPFSYLYFGGSLSFSLLLLITAMGSSMHRLQNIASMTLIAPNRVRIVAGDGIRHQILISEIKQVGYTNTQRSLLGHMVAVRYGAKKGQFCFGQQTQFNPQILWAILQQEVTHVMDQNAAQQFNKELQQGFGKIESQPPQQ